MTIPKAIASQVRVIFHHVYDASLSPGGALIVVACAGVACVAGQQLLHIAWRKLGFMTLVLLGAALAATPIRTFGISALDWQGWAFVGLGVGLIICGYTGLNWNRSQEAGGRHSQ